MLGKQEKIGNDAIIQLFAKRDSPEADANDGNGERLRISRKELEEIQLAIEKDGSWTASVTEWLFSKKAFVNHFSRDQGEKLYFYEGGVYRPTRAMNESANSRSASYPAKNGQVTSLTKPSNASELTLAISMNDRR